MAAATNPNRPGQLGLTSIANKWGVPPWLLYGVYGKETDWGRNVSTSSAGAIGLFQFIPETAARYGYPLTNRPTKAQARQQAEAAAKYLHDLYGEKGSWEAALRGYSGGGYGYQDVKAKASSSGGESLGAKILHYAEGPLGPQTEEEKSAEKKLEKLTPLALAKEITDTLKDPATWLRVLKVVGGLALAYLAVMQFSRIAQAQT